VEGGHLAAGAVPHGEGRPLIKGQVDRTKRTTLVDVAVAGRSARRVPKQNSGKAREISIVLLNNQRQHRTLHIKKDVLPYALC